MVIPLTDFNQNLKHIDNSGDKTMHRILYIYLYPFLSYRVHQLTDGQTDFLLNDSFQNFMEIDKFGVKTTCQNPSVQLNAFLNDIFACIHCKDETDIEEDTSIYF
ncbi:hypothetical protein AVEN_67245-1 [Araneus ventricosus]|uniref:Uncharacterized protein n=1 Tax=Araneus ventricosus TaxID=182803 RepID=A0A4Y2PZ21_ARAVE|nr:hypothetical protein AVEN_67245-1 [Araneus ventricosus]